MSGSKVQPRHPDYAAVVRESFARQNLMSTLGAELARVEVGAVEIRLPFRTDLTQQHGFLHAGAVTSVLDSACGYAALTCQDPGVGVLTVEFKTNLLAPARGPLLVARGRVVRSGRTIAVCQGEAVMIDDGLETEVATMMATIMTLRERPDVVG